MRQQRFLLLAVAVAGLAGGLWYGAAREPAEVPAHAQAEAAGLVGQTRPDFTLGASDGRRVSVSEFDGQVLLVNFWATWCAPCREEMPMLVELQNQYAGQGLAVVGIALDDVQQARDFADELGVNYTILVGGADVMAAGVAWGNQSGTLPYTVLVDRDGVVRWTLLGVLEHEELERQLQALL